MIMDICLDCGKIRQSPGDVRYYCSSCNRVTYHIVLSHYASADGYRKEDFDLENHFCGGL